MPDRYIGIDLGGTNVRTALVDTKGTIFAKDSRPSLSKESRDAPKNQIIESKTKICKEADCTVNEINALGICTPGPLDSEKGIVIYPANLDIYRHICLLAFDIRER